MPLHLPTLNAVLNGTAAVLLVAGLIQIRRGSMRRHRACMLAAFAASTLFLVSYLVHHWTAGSTRFPHQGGVRALYFAVLLTHTPLAALVPPLALVTLWKGLAGRFDQHRRLARWTFPIWMYVSVTGVVIYWMLYRL